MQESPSSDGVTEQPEGRYVNFFRVGFNPSEFVIDVGQFYAEGAEARMHTRLVTSPAYALELMRLLERSLDDFQQRFGRILG